MIAATRGSVALWFAAALLTAAVAVGAAGALSSIHASWTAIYGPFAHGYVILGLALWLALRLWQRDPPERFEGWWPPVLLLVAASVALWLMEAAFLNSARQVLVPVIVWAAAAAVFGRAVGRALFWPLAFVYFALPQWWVINTPLQQLTAAVANALVWVTGVPAYVEGNSFQLPAGVVEVANGCSGLNYLVVALALAMFQGLSYLRSWRLRLRLLVVAALVGLITNWLRVYLLILIGYTSGMQHYLIRVDHLYFGWVLFLVCMWPVFTYAARLEQREQKPGSATPLTAREAGGRLVRLSPVALLACVLVIVAPAAIERLGRTDSAKLPALPSLPDHGGPALLPMAPGVERTAWLDRGVSVEFGRWHLPYQTRASHLTGDPLEVLAAEEASRWRVSGQAADWTELSRGTAGIDGASELARVGYRVAGTPVAAGGGRFKLAVVLGAVQGRRDVDLWVVATTCQPDCATARRRLEASWPRAVQWMDRGNAAAP